MMGSVEKQMKKLDDFFIQIKHKCDGITVAEMKSQGKGCFSTSPAALQGIVRKSYWCGQLCHRLEDIPTSPNREGILGSEWQGNLA
jgi:hypothetical protein